jgi:hypothetical protein
MTNLLASVSTCLVLIGCGKGLEPIEIVHEEGTTNSATTDAPDDYWPECLPSSISDSSFVVGPDHLWGIYDPDINWPPGHHDAICVVDSTSGGIQLRECQDDLAQPIPLSLDLLFSSTVFTEFPPGLEADRSVRVSYSVTMWYESTHHAWYSLRDAETDELLLAAFADFGPSVVPKVEGENDLDNWLAPFEATLGAFGCAPELEGACEGNRQRAFVEFTRDGATWNVLGGTEGDLGDYRVHLGFAGASDACDGILSNHAIEGIIVRKP